MKKSGVYFNNGGLIFSVTVIIYIIVSFLGSLILKTFSDTESFLYNAVAPLFSVISIAGVLLFFKKKNKVSFSEFFSLKKFDKIFIPLALLLSVSMFFGLGFINSLLGEGLKSIDLKVAERTLIINNTAEYIVFVITWGILPAFFEEAFLRSGVFFLVDEKKPFLTALSSGLMFFLYHMSASQSAYQFVFGTFLFLLAFSANSVIPAMISHFVNNFAVLTLNYFNVNINMLNPYFITFGIIGLAVFCFLTVRIINKREKLLGSVRLSDIYLYASLGIVVCAFVIISGLFVG